MGNIDFKHIRVTHSHCKATNRKYLEPLAHTLKRSDPVWEARKVPKELS